MRNHLYTWVICTIFSLLIVSPMSAQALRGSYFAENATLRHRLNPAMMPDNGYLGLPVIGNTGVGVNSNLGLNNFLFPQNGQLLSFMHPDVSADDFLSALPEDPFLDVEFDTDLLSLGFYSSKNAFWTVDLSLRAMADTRLPYDLFAFAKQGMNQLPQSYTLRDFTLQEDLYAQVSVGYARDLSNLVEGLRVGAKAKLLLGVERIDLRINKADITLSQDAWLVNTDAVGLVMGKGIRLPENQDAAFEMPEIGDLGIGGFGYAFDLGAEYEFNLGIPILDGLRLSASLTDLGNISYSEDNVQQLVSAGSFTYEGFPDLTLDSYDFEAAFDQIADEFMALANFRETGLTESTSYSTDPRLYLGAEYPFLNNSMSVGVLYYSRFRPSRTESEVTFSYNYRPNEWLAAGVNYSFLNQAKSIGWLLEFTPKRGVNFFLGSDYTYLEFSPQFLPIERFCMNMRFGLTLSFANRFAKAADKD